MADDTFQENLEEDHEKAGSISNKDQLKDIQNLVQDLQDSLDLDHPAQEALNAAASALVKVESSL